MIVTDFSQYNHLWLKCTGRNVNKLTDNKNNTHPNLVYNN